MTQVDDLLQERLSRYGRFDRHSEISQELKDVIFNNLGYPISSLAPDQREALDMICHKLARIANGDPNYSDNWIDIAGYSQLVANRLDGTGIYATTA